MKMLDKATILNHRMQHQISILADDIDPLICSLGDHGSSIYKGDAAVVGTVSSGIEDGAHVSSATQLLIFFASKGF